MGLNESVAGRAGGKFEINRSLAPFLLDLLLKTGLVEEMFAVQGYNWKFTQALGVANCAEAVFVFFKSLLRVGFDALFPQAWGMFSEILILNPTVADMATLELLLTVVCDLLLTILIVTGLVALLHRGLTELAPVVFLGELYLLAGLAEMVRGGIAADTPVGGTLLASHSELAHMDC
jgi:hypothetical protein